MELASKVQAVVHDRVAQYAADRRRVVERYAAGDWAQLAPVEQTVRLLERDDKRHYAEEFRRLSEQATPDEGGTFESVGAEDRPDTSRGRLIFEQIIGRSEIMPVRFIHDGSRVARAIGRIVFANQHQPNGTGFLVSPRLMLTNFHVLTDEAAARDNLVQFNFLTEPDGSTSAPIEFRFQPDVVFLQSPIDELDFTLVAVEPTNATGADLSSFGWCPLIGEAGKEHPGERVNVVHHPAGNPKQVSLRENLLVMILPDHLHYVTDTMRGSSGSPVFNDRWEVVALHHAGIEITDDEDVAEYRRALGSRLPDGVDESGPVSVNEGARISRIVARLEEDVAMMDGDGRTLVEQTLIAAPPGPEAAVVDLPPVLSPSARGTTRIAAGPVTVTVTIGDGATPTNERPAESRPATSAVPGLELFRGEAQRSVIGGLAALQQRREEVYLPSDAEVAARRDAYYSDIPARVDAGNLSAVELYDELHELISEQGTLTIAGRFPERLESLETLRSLDLESAGVESTLILEDAKYDRSRAHLYTRVDLQEDRMLHGVYTDAVISPEQLLLRDLLVQLGLRAELPRRFRSDQFLNCEHIVPKSWFQEEPVARADLHHLITADGAANNFRRDNPYREIAPDEDAQVGPANRPEYMPAAGAKVSEPKGFEPVTNKPVVARATLYFLIAHKEKIDDSKYDAAAIQMLQGWANSAPPNRYEQHRNEAIFEIQGNRNPLIDFSGWVDGIDFTRGLATAP